MKKVSNVLTKIFHWMFFIVVTYLFACSLLVTAVHRKFENGIDEFAIVELNKPLPSLLVFVGGIILIVGFYWITEHALAKKRFNINVIAAIVCILAFAISVAWANMVNAIPAADQLYSIQCAVAMNNGDFTTITKGNYLSSYPHLLGLVAFLRLLFRIFGEGNYLAYRYFNAICIPIMIYAGFRIVKKLTSDDNRIELFYLGAMFMCIPAYAYVLYIYGDLAGPAFGILGFWFFYQCLDRVNAKNLTGLFLSNVAAITLRKSILIFALAMVVVLLVKMIGEIDRKDIAVLLVTIASMVFSVIYVNYLFLPNIADTKHAIPASVNIAMGLNDDYGYAGWYNFYEVNLMAECDDDPELASSIAVDNIKNVYIPLYIHNPKYAIDFFFRKINSQWQDPLYQGIVSNNNLEGQHNSFVNSVYYGGVGEFFNWFMKIYQVMMYATIAIVLFLFRKEKHRIENYAMLIATFGGFVLSLGWESKGRYIFSYFIILIPAYAIASGILYDKGKHLLKAK